MISPIDSNKENKGRGRRGREKEERSTVDHQVNRDSVRKHLNQLLFLKQPPHLGSNIWGDVVGDDVNQPLQILGHLGQQTIFREKNDELGYPAPEIESRAHLFHHFAVFLVEGGVPIYRLDLQAGRELTAREGRVEYSREIPLLLVGQLGLRAAAAAAAAGGGILGSGWAALGT